MGDPGVRRELVAATPVGQAVNAGEPFLCGAAADLRELANATDWPFTEELLDDDGLVDEGKVQAAVDDLVKRKPHLAARRPRGDVGPGPRPEGQELGLAAMLRRGA